MRRKINIMMFITLFIGVVCFVYGIVCASNAFSYIDIMGESEGTSSTLMYILDAALMPIATAFLLWAQAGVFYIFTHMVPKKK